MFEHSVKVPRQYKIAANIFKKVSTEGGSIKTLLYDNKLRHFRTNVLYALISETIKHASQLDKIFENTDILKKESRLDPWLAKVLTTELLFGKKSLPGKSKPEQTVLSYKDQFENYTKEHQDELQIQDRTTYRPRYVRINTNLLTTSDAIREFQDEGYTFVRCTSGSYNDYLQQLQNLNEYDFTQDYHVKTVFVFPANTKFHNHPLYLDHKLILQDKATTMAVHLLAPPTGSVVLDMCAAPGMKTTQLAAYMRNTGTVYSVERNEERYKTLCDFVEKTGSTCVKTIHRDTLEIRKGEYDDVEYILLDPSCSGSGMDLSVHKYIEETRLAKLTSLQEKFLKHAMNAFPNAKRIVYSTCSLRPEENERVITNVVKTSRSKWKVQDVKEMLKGQWNNIGSGMYGSMGVRCIYSLPENDLTTGFFLAVLDRDQKEEISQGDKKKDKYKQLDDLNGNEAEDNNESKKCIVEKEVKEGGDADTVQKKKKIKKQIVDISIKDQDTDVNGVVKPKKHKRKAKDEISVVNQNELDVIADIQDYNPSQKKKKKTPEMDSESQMHVEHLEVEISDQKKTKKKKKKCNETGQENAAEKSIKKKGKDVDKDSEVDTCDNSSEIKETVENVDVGIKKSRKKKHK